MNDADFSYPDPTVLKLDEQLYLVLTELDKNRIPSLCFYRLDAMEIGRTPDFKVPRAELLIGHDGTNTKICKGDNIIFLTNDALLNMQKNKI